MFDRSEISLSERHLAVDVVEVAVVGGRTVAEFGFGEELEDGRGHDVRGGVADDTQRCRIILFEELQRNVFVQRRGEIDQAFACGIVAGVHRLFGLLCLRFVVRGLVGSCDVKWAHARDNDGCGQSWRDAVGDVERRRSVRDLTHGAVRKLDFYLLAHKTSIATVR